MASATATHQPLRRIVSRRAHLLLQKHRAKQGGYTLESLRAARAPPKKDETPWPKSLRYTFYTVCVVSIPFSIGQAIALSPRLREWMVGDDVEEEENVNGSSSSSSNSGLSSRKIISMVREYWGHEDYVPPVDRPALKHTVPGHQYEWQEDNQSSFMQLLGLYTPKEEEEENVSVPMSLDNEPNSHVRRDQMILSQYLSTKTNPRGVKTRLSLLPYATTIMDQGEEEPGYETECTLPGSTPASTLRDPCKGSMAQVLRRDLMESDPDFHARATEETLRTKHWNEKCRWVVSFADSDSKEENGVTVDGALMGDATSFGQGGTPSLENFGGSILSSASSLPQASKEFRHSTSIHSSWSYFPDLATASSPLSNSMNTSLGSSSRSSGRTTTTTTVSSSGTSTSTTTTLAAPSNESLQMQRLEYQVDTLERELKDPSSLRDRDTMYEELKAAKRELRGLKPWYKRFW